MAVITSLTARRTGFLERSWKHFWAVRGDVFLALLALITGHVRHGPYSWSVITSRDHGVAYDSRTGRVHRSWIRAVFTGDRPHSLWTWPVITAREHSPCADLSSHICFCDSVFFKVLQSSSRKLLLSASWFHLLLDESQLFFSVSIWSWRNY